MLGNVLFLLKPILSLYSTYIIQSSLVVTIYTYKLKMFTNNINIYKLYTSISKNRLKFNPTTYKIEQASCKKGGKRSFYTTLVPILANLK